MDERKQRILQAIIQDYVKTAEPVASRTIARNHNLGISAATVRNEMYDLEALGYLEQPHSSSGRIPSAKGYRFYVDSILHRESLTPEDAELLRALWMETPRDFGEFIQQTAKLISQVSHNMSMVLGPSRDQSTIRFLHALYAGERRAILVVVTDAGALDNEPLFFDSPITMEELESAAQKLSNALLRVPLHRIDANLLQLLVQQMDGQRDVLRVITEGVYRAINKRKLFYAVGTPELLEQPEFRNSSMVQPILNLLEEQDELSRLLTNRTDAPISVRIGTENMDAKIHNCSIIQADFSAGDEHLGTLAILGPTRMEYGRLVGMLYYMQQFLQQFQQEDCRHK